MCKLGDPEGYFENLDMYYGMIFNIKSNIAPPCSIGKDKQSMRVEQRVYSWIKKKDGKLQTFQLNTIAYPWEILYDMYQQVQDSNYFDWGED